MVLQNEMFSSNTALIESFNRLNDEIANLIQQKYTEYEACMNIPSREYFAESIDEFLSNFSQTMEECSMQLSALAKKINRKLKVALLHFRDYVVRGLWIIHKSPKCKEQLEDMYYIPDSFDIDGLKNLIDDVRGSITLEDAVNDMQQRDMLRTVRINMLQSLDSIRDVIDGDKKTMAFTIRRWVAKLRSDLREIRSIYENQWEKKIESFKDEYIQESLCQLRDDVRDELENSEFYIDNLDDLDELVRKIHSFQGHGCGEELDRFLHDYALLEFLDGKLERYKVKCPVQRISQIFNGDVNFHAGSTQNGNVISK